MRSELARRHQPGASSFVALAASTRRPSASAAANFSPFFKLKRPSSRIGTNVNAPAFVYARNCSLRAGTRTMKNAEGDSFVSRATASRADENVLTMFGAPKETGFHPA